MPADTSVERRTLIFKPVSVTVALAVATSIGWVVLIDRRVAPMGMSLGMNKNAGSAKSTAFVAGTSSLNATAFLTVWVAMVAAMMLPTIQPMLVTYRSLFRNDAPRVRHSRTGAFLLPYAMLWVTVGTGALGLWNVGRDHPVFTGTLVAAAGVYQLGGIKSRCLRWCRSPFGFLVRFGGDARSIRGAFSLGARHATICVGCCAGLMIGLTGAGIMSISWLAALGLLMFMEKTHRAGAGIAKASGVVLIALGIATAVAPLSRLASDTTGLVAIAVLGFSALVPPRHPVIAGT